MTESVVVMKGAFGVPAARKLRRLGSEGVLERQWQWGRQAIVWCAVVKVEDSVRRVQRKTADCSGDVMRVWDVLESDDGVRTIQRTAGGVHW